MQGDDTNSANGGQAPGIGVSVRQFFNAFGVRAWDFAIWLGLTPNNETEEWRRNPRISQVGDLGALSTNERNTTIGIAVDSTGGVHASRAQHAVSSSVRPTPAELLIRVLFTRPRLNLTDKIIRYAEIDAGGGFADVYRGYVKGTNQLVAVKVLRVEFGGNEKLAKDIAREIRIWSEFDHPNVQPILGFSIEKNYPSLISEWMVEGSLFGKLEQLSRVEKWTMIQDIASGLEYMHSRNAIHSDLKSANVLVTPKKRAKLTDFGASRMEALSVGYTTRSSKGSVRWQAYEFFDIREGNDPAPKHTKETDVWAFGMTVYELLTNKLPYHHAGVDAQIINQISRGYLPRKPQSHVNSDDKKFQEDLWSLCNMCWDKNPSKRPIMSDFKPMLLRNSART